MAEKKKRHIFSDEFRKKSHQFGMNLRNDIDGMADRTLIAITGFTLLVMFWWYIGRFAENIYVAQWIEQYPTIPLAVSYGYHVFKFMNVVTPVFICGVWIFVLIHLFILTHTEKDLEQTPRKPSKRKETSSANTACKYCKSIKTRIAGKEHPDKMFCKSCRRYF
jgi:hypothetical protein